MKPPSCIARSAALQSPPRAILKTAALTMAAFALACRPSIGAPAAGDVLRNSARAEKTLAFTAVETIERPGAPAVKLRVQRDGRQRRLDYLAPDVRRGDAVIDNGREVWIYLKSENAAVQTLSRPESDGGPRPGGTARIAGTGTVEDRVAWIVETTRGNMQRRLWIDQKNGAMLRREMRRGGQLMENSELGSIRFGDVPASTFAYKPPAGAKVSRISGTLYTNANAARRVASLRFPAWTPPGYAFESAIVDDKNGETWLRFSGARRFSIFQSRAAGEIPLQQVDGAWFLARGGNRFVIVGLDEANTRKLADSL